MSGLGAWLLRPARAWALIAVCAACAGVYAAALWAVAHPRVSEAYRRTFMTAEFRVYPASAVFAPEDGLAYRPGETINGRATRGRRHFARFEWRRRADDAMALRGEAGRLFLFVPAAANSGAPHRLVAAFACPENRDGTRLAVSVNGAPVEEAVCAAGAARLDATVPADVFPRGGWETILVARPGAGGLARFGARLGFPGQTFTLERLSLTLLDDGEG